MLLSQALHEEELVASSRLELFLKAPTKYLTDTGVLDLLWPDSIRDDSWEME